MKERIVLWDNLKFILITLVVVGHFADVFTVKSFSYQSLYMFIYAFHMPLFIFISGLFHKDTNIGAKCLFFISVGFLQKILFLLVPRFFGTINPGFSVLSDSNMPWFMFALAAYTLLVYAFRNQNKRYILIAAIVLGCFIGYDYKIGDYLYLSRILIFFPFYLAGTMVNGIDLVEFKKKHKWLIVIALAILFVWAYLCFNKLDDLYKYRHLLTGRNSFSKKVIEYGPLKRLMCYGISVLTSGALIFLVPSIKIPWFSKMGTRSLDVYFWHWIVYMLLDHYLNISNVFHQGQYGKVVFLLIAVGVSIVLAQGIIFSFPLKQIKKACYAKPK